MITPESVTHTGDPVPRPFRGALTAVLIAAVAMALGACDSGNGDSTPPKPPEGLEATSGEGEVTLSWSPVETEDLAEYNVYRSTSSLPDTLSSEGRIMTVSGTEFVDPSVQNQTTYFYRVTAVDENDNESGASGEESVTPFAGPPDRP